MNKILLVLQIIVPVFTILALGYFVKRKRIINKQGISGLKIFVTKFTLPILIFGVFYKFDFGKDALFCFVVILLSCCLGLLIGHILNRVFHNRHSLLRLLTTGYETGSMGYALYILLFGKEHLASIALINLGNVVFIFTIYLFLINVENGGKKENSLRFILKSPLVWSLILGLIFGISGLGKLIDQSALASIIEKTLSFISEPTSCVILFVVGYELYFSISFVKKAIVYCLLRLVVASLLCLLCLSILPLLITMDKYMMYAVLLLFSLPPVFILPILLQKEEEIMKATACISLYTIITVFVFGILALSAI